MFVLAIPCAIGIMLVADLMVPIMFGASFDGAIMTTRILAISIVTVAFSNFLGNQVLVTVGKERQVMYSTFLGAVINVLLNIILINNYQHNGAAIASVITEGGVTLFQIFCVRRVTKIDFDVKFICSTMVAIFSMIISVLAVKYFVTNIIESFLGTIIIGATVYVIVLLMLKNEMVRLFIRQMRR